MFLFYLQNIIHICTTLLVVAGTVVVVVAVVMAVVVVVVALQHTLQIKQLLSLMALKY